MNGLTDADAASANEERQNVAAPRLLTFTVTFTEETDERKDIVATHGLKKYQ